MRSAKWIGLRAAVFLATAAGVAIALGSLADAGTAAAAPTLAPSFLPPLAHPPLDPPLRLSGTFGEHRNSHIHAGVDISTNEHIGRQVYASLDGHIERLRSSGVGYGRSIYLHATDGRLLVYGHLDAFDEPLASYVDSVQRATGQYEQDLWPPESRFVIHAGQWLGWSGRSGTGPPHLHFEIRHGDMAYNPLRAGLEVEDTAAPVIRSVTLEPMDAPRSTVACERAPATLTFGRGEHDRVLDASGPVRLIVDAGDARASGALTMEPWRVRAEVGGEWVEAEFDSVSWASDMGDVDGVYDCGRATTSSDAVDLWDPPAPRPRVLQAGREPGTGGWFLTLPDTGATRTVRITAEDAAGHESSATFEIRPRECFIVGAPPSSPHPKAPEPFWQLRDRSLLLRLPALRPPATLTEHPITVEPGHALHDHLGAFSVTVPAGVPYEGKVVGAIEAWERSPRTAELLPVGGTFALRPYVTPLRAPARVAIDAGPGANRDRLGLYRDSGDGWEWLGADLDSTGHRVTGESKHFGRFALFRDVKAPRIKLAKPPRHAVAGPYSRWALEAALDEHGSGVAARASYMVVDGARVPAEWDAEKDTLRWRPLRPPQRGAHRVEVVAADHAGNVSRTRGRFVLE